ncbi:conserved membrane hypothetical protein [Methylocella tundrae]|jgi:hypothetical protein|uniref:HXXEE domain-containing protein n=1 Tax=Methylocella tundrae TaxID=227605 RepID=A0A4U8YVL5_METTU|nr:HXXEE domain-containing protein [Methylocella tundrae]WPP05081.1 HXXEE domain-containing protein [Methylocella tundrae]VFU07384.1 conserved membrane protein of unknown function [Methylocella tundrae]VTZ24182.1 conserved membrane hypothetical protein [Methylocella tundrae]VTZ49203.1 conserved membrane hypothetical protein [Methylocella tundrae]
MSYYEWSWLAVGAYAVHILEEFALDWRNWARAVIKLPVEWSDFYVTNAVVIVLGVVQAQLSTSLPVLFLAYAALMLINATFFHVLPMIVTGGRFSPGVVTAVCLFCPIGLGSFRQAGTDGDLSAGVAFAAVTMGAALMAFPIILLRAKSRPYFRQTV